ncbi:MAG: SpoIIE family protein phosphatase [Chloroflexi bacterium]|nr:SpoIIE family protein phosphatase [Chloroflexota bacterium]
MKIQEFSRASIEHPDRCEDAVMVFDGNSNGDSKAPVFAVIDGMGGQQHETADGRLMTGRDASQLVRTTLIEDLQRLPPDIDGSANGEAEQKVIAALNRAHERLRLELNNGDEFPAGHRVGAVVTVVVVCENGSRLLTVQVGDTRGYLFTDGELIQLCPDEDNLEYFVRLGLLSAEDSDRIGTVLNTYNGVDEPQAEGTIAINGNPYDLYIAWRWFLVGNTVLNIPPANIVINALGVHDEDPIAQTSRIEIGSGDTLLLCSDGLYKNLAEAEVIEGLAHGEAGADDLGEAAYARSQDSANRRSTQDDISVILVSW